MTITPVETIQTIYTHIRAGEWDVVDTYLSDDFVAYEPEALPFGGEWSGDLVFKRLFGAVMGSFEAPQVEPIDMSGGDEWVCYAINLSFMSQLTKERVSFRVIEHGHVIDGKLHELHLHYFDTASMLKHMEAGARA